MILYEDAALVVLDKPAGLSSEEPSFDVVFVLSHLILQAAKNQKV